MTNRDLRQVQGAMATGAKWLGIGVVAVGVVIWVRTQFFRSR
jgi:hypothetical protein